jgi:hypothetical protein
VVCWFCGFVVLGNGGILYTFLMGLITNFLNKVTGNPLKNITNTEHNNVKNENLKGNNADINKLMIYKSLINEDYDNISELLNGDDFKNLTKNDKSFMLILLNFNILRLIMDVDDKFDKLETKNVHELKKLILNNYDNNLKKIEHEKFKKFDENGLNNLTNKFNVFSEKYINYNCNNIADKDDHKITVVCNLIKEFEAIIENADKINVEGGKKRKTTKKKKTKKSKKHRKTNKHRKNKK